MTDAPQPPKPSTLQRPAKNPEKSKRRRKQRLKSCLLVAAGVLVLGGIIGGIAAYTIYDRFVRPALALRDLQDLQPTFEARIAQSGLHIVPLEAPLPAGALAVSLRIDPEQLQTHQLYLRPPNPKGSYVHIDAAGNVLTGIGELDPVEDELELLITPEGLTVFIDGRRIIADLSAWSVAWLSQDAQAPELQPQTIYEPMRFADDFSRQTLSEELWRVHQGEWQAAHDTATWPPHHHPLRGDGMLQARAPALPEAAARAAFYFGSLATDLPMPDTDLLIAMGSPAGPMAAFGWRQELADFALLHRSGPMEPWTVTPLQLGLRPLPGNWVEMGLELSRGHIITPLLDGDRLGKQPLPYRIDGPLMLLSGAAPILVDDALYTSLPAPAQTEDTAHGPLTVSDQTLRNLLPVIGSLTYAGGQAVAPGRYELRLREAGNNEAMLSLTFSKDAAGWQSLSLPPFQWADEHREPVLRLRRDLQRDGRLLIHIGGQAVPLGPASTAPLILELTALEGTPAPTIDAHHLADSLLAIETFTSAPVQWAWQSSNPEPPRPVAASRMRYHGDQGHAIRLGAEAGHLAFCAQGLQPDSGYAVTVREGLELRRRGKIVATAERPPAVSMIAATKVGKRIAISLDGAEVLVWEDPQPLPGGHLLLWADHGHAPERLPYIDTAFSTAARTARQPFQFYTRD